MKCDLVTEFYESLVRQKKLFLIVLLGELLVVFKTGKRQAQILAELPELQHCARLYFPISAMEHGVEPLPPVSPFCVGIRISAADHGFFPEIWNCNNTIESGYNINYELAR